MTNTSRSGHHGHDHGDHGHDHGDHGHGDADHGHAGHGHHQGGHDHSHGGFFSGHDHSHDLRGVSKRSLTLALTLIVGYMFAEIVGGILSGSLALVADAGHMATDAASIALALIAMRLAERAATAERTFGYQRLEILAALANALTLWVIVGGILYEAWRRFQEVPEIHGLLMLSVGGIGLLVNIAAAWILHRSAEHSVNVEGAFQHVMADLLGSVGVLISGGLVWAFEWTLADPIVTVFISILILRGTWGLLAKVIHVLLEGVPAHIDVYKLCSQIEGIQGVTLIHDIHVWTLSPGSEALSAHVLIDPDYPGDLETLLRHMRGLIRNGFGINHITIQLEKSAGDCTENHHVDHLLAHSKAG